MLIKEAVASIDRAASVVPAFHDAQFFRHPANVLPPPGAHVSGTWARTTTGNFALEDGQALVFTLDPAGADYLGVQTADILTGTIEPERLASTLNNRQVAANADGTITYVLAPRDPGTGNWLDTGGVTTEILMIRWQGLLGTVPIGPQRPPRAQVVPISGVRAFLNSRGSRSHAWPDRRRRAIAFTCGAIPVGEPDRRDGHALPAKPALACPNQSFGCPRITLHLSRDTPARYRRRGLPRNSRFPRPRLLIGMQLAPRYQPLKRTMPRRPRPVS